MTQVKEIRPRLRSVESIKGSCDIPAMLRLLADEQAVFNCHYAIAKLMKSALDDE